MFPLICVSINDWINNREAGDLRHYRGHYDVTVMCTGNMVGNHIWFLKVCWEAEPRWGLSKFLYSTDNLVRTLMQPSAIARCVNLDCKRKYSLKYWFFIFVYLALIRLCLNRQKLRHFFLNNTCLVSEDHAQETIIDYVFLEIVEDKCKTARISIIHPSRAGWLMVGVSSNVFINDGCDTSDPYIFDFYLLAMTVYA